MAQTTPMAFGVLYLVMNPVVGQWQLNVPSSVGEHSYTVKSSSEANIGFDFYFTVEQRRREVPVIDPLLSKYTQVKTRVT